MKKFDLQITHSKNIFFLSKTSEKKLKLKIINYHVDHINQEMEMDDGENLLLLHKVW